MSFENAKRQIEKKPVKLARFLKFNKSKARKYGKALKPCRRCGKTEGIVHKYDLCYCRQCFRDVARELGFEKYQ